MHNLSTIYIFNLILSFCRDRLGKRFKMRSIHWCSWLTSHDWPMFEAHRKDVLGDILIVVNVPSRGWSTGIVRSSIYSNRGQYGVSEFCETACVKPLKLIFVFIPTLIDKITFCGLLEFWILQACLIPATVHVLFPQHRYARRWRWV